MVVPLQVTTPAKVSRYGAAAGRAIARQDATGSWDITLTDIPGSARERVLGSP